MIAFVFFFWLMKQDIAKVKKKYEEKQVFISILYGLQKEPFIVKRQKSRDQTILCGLRDENLSRLVQKSDSDCLKFKKSSEMADKSLSVSEAETPVHACMRALHSYCNLFVAN
ncbi:hypothetical protein OWV82_013241 [Melia azedarach]|uniref:Uncharacterized protein n=1 Tax=Melia azedarach TaxID=155640 RepID=A0ACC1XV73_MELAZ|nr:hypothetical protein OWV82_013241 [Melia azedarach]